MSIMIPPELQPFAKITVGQEFPTGNEDHLAELGAVWNTTAQELNQLLGELNPATAATFESLAGAPAEQFGQFVNQLSSTLPVMATSAEQLGQMAQEIALEIEYAKYMIILQLAWMAAEIAYLTATGFGAAAVPAVVTMGRFAVQTILRELFIAVITSIVMQVGMDAAVQVLQFLKGDRTHWDWNATKSAAEMGALGGLVGGGMGQLMRHLAPGFSKSLLGNAVEGALSGLGTAEASNLIFGAGQDLGLGAAAGALGGAIAHGHTLHGGKAPDHIDVPTFDKSFAEALKHDLESEVEPGTLENPVSVPEGDFRRVPEEVPDAASGQMPGEMPDETSEQVPEEHETGQRPDEELLDLPDVPKPFDASAVPDPSPNASPDAAGQRPAEEHLDLPDAPKPFDASALPDPSPRALVSDLPSAPTGRRAPLPQQVRSRVDGLSTTARTAGLPETQWRRQADSVREAARSGDWAEAARRLHDFRTAVEHGILDQRLTDFRTHVEGGFSRLRELGVEERAWRSQVDAVERAQRTGDPVLLDSRLKEYTDFVERHLPVEMVSGNGARTFDSGAEQLRREIATVSDPTVREALQKDLEWHRQMQQRLDRLAQSDPESDIMRRRTIAVEESAQSPQEAAQAREGLREFQDQRYMQRRLDDVHQGAAETKLERRLEALRERALPDTRGQELLQRVLDANTPEEHERALRDLVAHNQLAPQERQLNTLREGLLPAEDPQREQLVQKVENARTPQESRQAQQELKEYTDRQIQEQQQAFTERLHTQQDARTQTADEALLRRIDGLNGGTPQDPREVELRQRLDAATSPQERSQVIHELGVRRQEVLQQRVDAATTPQERKQALDAQARFNNWTPVERRMAELRTVLNPGGAPQADAHRADLVRQVENARTPQEARQAQQELKQYTDRQIEEQTRQLEERLRQQGGGGAGSAAAAAHADLMRRFEALRGDGSHQDPHEAELIRRMEAAGSPQEARTAERQLNDYLGEREQQRRVDEQQRLAQVRAHEQEVSRLRDQLTQERRSGAPEEAVRETQHQLDQAEQRLATTRTPDENTAALRHELQQQIDGPESGSDRPGAGSGRGGGTEPGTTGSGSRLDRLVQEGVTRRAEQELARTQEQQQFLPQEPDEHAQFTLDELDSLPSAPTTTPDALPTAPAHRPDGLPDVPAGRPGSVSSTHGVEPGAVSSTHGVEPGPVSSTQGVEPVSASSGHAVEPGAPPSSHTGEPDVLASASATRPEPSTADRADPLPDMRTVPGSGTGPDATVPPGLRPVGDEPRVPLSDAAAGRIASEIEGLPGTQVSPLGRQADAPTVQGHAETPPQARQPRVETSAPGPASDVMQAQRSRPAADTELPSPPDSGPRVDRATMPSRVPQVSDLERTLAEIEHEDVAPAPAHGTSATQPEHATGPTEHPTAPAEQITGPGRAADHVAPPSGNTSEAARTRTPSSAPVAAPAADRALTDRDAGRTGAADNSRVGGRDSLADTAPVDSTRADSHNGTPVVPVAGRTGSGDAGRTGRTGTDAGVGSRTGVGTGRAATDAPVSRPGRTDGEESPDSTALSPHEAIRPAEPERPRALSPEQTVADGPDTAAEPGRPVAPQRADAAVPVEADRFAQPADTPVTVDSDSRAHPAGAPEPLEPDTLEQSADPRPSVVAESRPPAAAALRPSVATAPQPSTVTDPEPSAATEPRTSDASGPVVVPSDALSMSAHAPSARSGGDLGTPPESRRPGAAAEDPQAQAQQWQQFRDERDTAYHDRFRMAEQRTWHIGGLAGDFDTAVARFRDEDLFGGAHLADDSAALRQVREGFRKDAEAAFEAGWQEAGGRMMPQHDWQARLDGIRSTLPDRLARASEAERQATAWDPHIDDALTRFREDDLFGGAHLDDPRTMAEFRAAERARVGDTVATVWEQSAGRSADWRAMRLESALGELRSGLGERLTEASELHRYLRHGERQFEQTVDTWEEDLAGGGRLGEEAAARTRQEFGKDLRAAWERLADAPARQSAFDELVAGLPQRLEHAQFRELQSQRARQVLDEAFGRFEDDLAGGGRLGEAARERLAEEWTKAVESALDEHWFGTPAHTDFRLRPADTLPEEPAGTPPGREQTGADEYTAPGAGRPSWEERFDRLTDTLTHRLEHEAALHAVLERAAEDFHGIAGHPESGTHRYDVSDEAFKALAEDFRRDTVTARDRIWAPENHDTEAWLRHEAEHENTFGTTLDEAQTASLPAVGDRNAPDNTTDNTTDTAPDNTTATAPAAAAEEPATSSTPDEPQSPVRAPEQQAAAHDAQDDVPTPEAAQQMVSRLEEAQPPTESQAKTAPQAETAAQTKNAPQAKSAPQAETAAQSETSERERQSVAAAQDVRDDTTDHGVRDVEPGASLSRFAERQFGKLSEPKARQLWAEASQITAKHLPFRLTIDEDAGGLRERAPEQYWATMRVAQVLQENEGAADRGTQAEAAARDMAAQRGVGAVRENLRGGAAEAATADRTRQADGPTRTDESATSAPQRGEVIGAPAEVRSSGEGSTSASDARTARQAPQNPAVLPLRGAGALTEQGARITRAAGDAASAVPDRLEFVGPDGLPLPGHAVRSGPDGGFIVSGTAGELHFTADGDFTHRDVPLPGTGHVARFDTPSGVDTAPRLLDGNGSPVPGADIRRAGHGGVAVTLPVRGQEETRLRWDFDEDGALRDQSLIVPDRLAAAVDHTLDLSGLRPEGVVWRDSYEPLWRYDLRPPKVVFKQGFEAKGTERGDLAQYVVAWGPSMFVSTSKDDNYT
ncbi:MAG: hypothetical protein HOY79_32710, partial [Streptomyces sp.]|nr:hypothetical protein [Streptomyces sp.]